MNFTIRAATSADCSDIHRLVLELAKYERAKHEVETSPRDFLRHGFEAQNPLFACFVAELENGEIVGLALSYFRYSTWKGKMLHLEDLYVEDRVRGKGIGLQLLRQTAEYALEQQCNRLGWEVLDWNTPAIDFYKSIGAVLEPEWINCRLKTTADIKQFLKETK